MNFYEKTLRILSEHNLDLCWYCNNNGLIVAIDVAGFFEWVAPDDEQILEEDLPGLERAIQDATEAGMMRYGPRLWAARKRNMRPQGTAYRCMTRPIAELFNQMPVREIGPDNPHEPIPMADDPYTE